MLFILFFFFNDTATTEIYTLSLHDALPISREQPQRRQTLRELLRLTIELEHRLERGERHLVHTQRTLEVVAFDFFYELVAPDDDAGLRPAEELVAAEGHEIGAVCQRLLRGRLFRQSILA